MGFADDARLLEELECRPFEELEPRPFDDPDPLDDDFAAVERFADDVASASITV